MLKLYQNIKERRQELGLTQQELAERVGYSSGKGMIAKIEKGEVDLTQSKISQFAKALNTTPGHLMGWDIKLELNSIKADLCIETQDQGDARQVARLLKYFKYLNTDDQEYIIEFTKYLSEKKGNEGD